MPQPFFQLSAVIKEKQKQAAFVSKDKLQLNFCQINTLDTKSDGISQKYKGVKKLFLSHNYLSSLEGI